MARKLCRHKNCTIGEMYLQEYVIEMKDGVITEAGLYPDKHSTRIIEVRCQDCGKNIRYNKDKIPKWIKKAIEESWRS